MAHILDLTFFTEISDTNISYSYDESASLWDGWEHTSTESNLYFGQVQKQQLLNTSSQNEQQQIDSAIQIWEDYSAFNITKLNSGKADINIYKANMLPNSGVNGVAGTFESADATQSSTIDLTVPHVRAEIVFNNSIDMSEEGFSYYLALHEIGHALGLSHPRNQSLNSEYDITKTVMSYNTPAQENATVQVDHWSITPMAYDIAALRELYGTFDHNKQGDSVYDKNTLQISGDLNAQTIVDTGGLNDVIDLSDVAGTHIIDLRTALDSNGNWTGHKTIVGGKEWVFIDQLSVIENAIGGDGKDTLIGNAADNTFVGGREGDDIDGGDGHDTVDYSSDGATAGITANLALDSATNSILVVDGFGKTDKLKNIEHIIGSDNGDTFNIDMTEQMTGSNPNQVFWYSSEINYLHDFSTTSAVGNISFETGTGNDTINFEWPQSVLNNVDYSNNFSGNWDNIASDLPGGILRYKYNGGHDTITGADMVGLDIILPTGIDQATDITWSITGNPDKVSNLPSSYGPDHPAELYKANMVITITGHGSITIEDHLIVKKHETELTSDGSYQLTGGFSWHFPTQSSGTNSGVDWTSNDVGNVLVLKSLDTSGDLNTFRLSAASREDNIDNVDPSNWTFEMQSVSSTANTVIRGSRFSDTIDLSARTDAFVHAASLEAGDDTLIGSAFDDQFYLGKGNDTATGGNGDDTFWGEDGDDILNGSAGSDNLYGGAGNDTLNGGDNNDTLHASIGADTLDGGAGFDTADFSEVAGAISVDLGSGSAVNGDTGQSDTLISIEHIIGTDGNDSIIGDASGNNLHGGSGNDIITGGAGIDSVLSGSGNDTIRHYVANNLTNIDNYYAGTGIDTFEIYFDTEAQYASFAAELESYKAHLRANSNSGTTSLSVTTSTGTVLSDFERVDSYVGGVLRKANEDIDGTVSAENIIGTESNELFSAFAGGDSIYAGGGNDTVYAGEGNDRLVGDDGDDTLYGETGSDRLIGGVGNDTLDGGDGFDVADYSAAANAVHVNLHNGVASNDGDGGSDTLVSIEDVTGSAGNDTLVGSTDDNILRGEDGDDLIYGYDGDDTLYGGDGNDDLRGQNGIDTYYGGNGNDFILGGQGDIAYGEAGDDVIRGYGGTGLFDGGEGTDRVWWRDYYNAGNVGITVDLAAGTATDGDNNVATLVSIENITGSSYDDILHGDNNINIIRGGGNYNGLTDGDDTIYGYGGNDKLYGDAGVDTIYGGDGDDTISGNAGNDILHGGAGVDYITGDEGDDTIYAGAGNDEIYAGAGLDTVYGGEGNDTLWGEEDADILYGDEGSDYLYGYGDNDALSGGAGIDYMYGGDGDDTLTFDQDSDRMYGNAGADTFIAEEGSNLDHAMSYIYDFAESEDHVDVSDLLGGYNSATDTLSDFVNIAQGYNTTIQIDRDGAGTAHGWDNVVRLQGNTTIGTNVDQLVLDGTLIV